LPTAATGSTDRTAVHQGAVDDRTPDQDGNNRWVMVKTKTRSKNSSSELTRGSAEPAEYGEGMASFTAPEITVLLQDELEMERRFVAEAVTEPDFPRGWSAGLLMAHIASWRTRLRDSLIESSRGMPVTGPPADIDAFNAVELARNARISLEAAATEADTRLGDLMDLWATVGDRPFVWFTAKTTGEALIRNSYIHPRRHLAEHYIERGDRSRGARLKEDTMAELRRIDAPESVTSVWS